MSMEDVECRDITHRRTTKGNCPDCIRAKEGKAGMDLCQNLLHMRRAFGGDNYPLEECPTCIANKAMRRIGASKEGNVLKAAEQRREYDEILEASGFKKCTDSHRGMYMGGNVHHWHRPGGGMKSADGETWPYSSDAIWAIAEDRELDQVVAEGTRVRESMKIAAQVQATSVIVGDLSINISDNSGNLRDLDEIITELEKFHEGISTHAMSDHQLYLRGKKEGVRLIIQYLRRVAE